MLIISYANQVAIKGTFPQEKVSFFANDFCCKKRNYVGMKNRIREWRIKNNLTQEQLADLLGRNKSAVSKLENGKIELTHNMMMTLSKLLKCSVTDLIIETDQSEREASILDLEKNRIHALHSLETQMFQQITELQEAKNNVGFLKICYATGNTELAAHLEPKIKTYVRKFNRIKIEEPA